MFYTGHKILSIQLLVVLIRLANLYMGCNNLIVFETMGFHQEWWGHVQNNGLVFGITGWSCSERWGHVWKWGCVRNDGVVFKIIGSRSKQRACIWNDGVGLETMGLCSEWWSRVWIIGLEWRGRVRIIGLGFAHSKLDEITPNFAHVLLTCIVCFSIFFVRKKWADVLQFGSELPSEYLFDLTTGTATVVPNSDKGIFACGIFCTLREARTRTEGSSDNTLVG